MNQQQIVSDTWLKSSHECYKYKHFDSILEAIIISSYYMLRPKERQNVITWQILENGPE